MDENVVTNSPVGTSISQSEATPGTALFLNETGVYPHDDQIPAVKKSGPVPVGRGSESFIPTPSVNS